MVCVSEKLCVSKVWIFQRLKGGLKEKPQNVALRGNVNMDVSPDITKKLVVFIFLLKLPGKVIFIEK